MPLRFIYFLSNCLYIFFFYIIQYRRKVVQSNLRNSFPELNKHDISKIEKKHYKYFTDLILESFKTRFWTKSQVLKHIYFTDNSKSLIKKHKDMNQSIIMVLGHYGNWEWAASCMDLSSDYQQYIIYKEIRDKNFEKEMNFNRSKFGAELIEMKDFLRFIISKKDLLFSISMNADQAPPKSGAYWTKFLNQKTAFFNGPSKIAHKLNLPIFYTSIKKVKRGEYEIELTQIKDIDSNEDINATTQKFVKALEKDIKSDPSLWLWTHRRWK